MTKILIIGEVCEDIFIYGNIERLCPEAPVPILKPIEYRSNRGMAGNVSENLKVLFNDCVVDEIFQQTIIKKTRFVDKKSNQMIIRIDEGENVLCDNLIIDNKTIQKIIDSNLIIISDYNKGFISDEDLIKIGKLAKISILDSKRILSDEIVNNFTFVKLNELEFKQNSHLKKTDNILITMGAKGVLYQNKIYPTKPILETIDVSGAGDTFVAAFITNYFKTKKIEESIIFANKKCSLVVSKRGVVVPN